MTRRLVFVPMFGDIGNGGGDDSSWKAAPHVKAWGFFGGEDSFEAIYTDPPCKAVRLGQQVELFRSEMKIMVELTGDEPDIPTEVAVALARMALLPEKELPDGN